MLICLILTETIDDGTSIVPHFTGNVGTLSDWPNVLGSND